MKWGIGVDNVGSDGRARARHPVRQYSGDVWKRSRRPGDGLCDGIGEAYRGHRSRRARRRLAEAGGYLACGSNGGARWLRGHRKPDGATPDRSRHARRRLRSGIGRSPAARRHRGGGLAGTRGGGGLHRLDVRADCSQSPHAERVGPGARATRRQSRQRRTRPSYRRSCACLGASKRPGVSSGARCVRRGAAGCRLAAPRARSLYSRLAQRLEYRGRRAAGQQPGHRPALRIFGVS